MSIFRRLVEKVINKQKRSRIKIQPRTIEELKKIFAVDESNLFEDSNETKTLLWLARKLYTDFLEKIKTNKYEKTKYGGIVYLDDLEIEFTITGKTGDGIYTKNENRILVYVGNLNDLKNDLFLRNALIHEITHHISHDDENNYFNYISPDINRQEYLTQPLEFEANKITICDYLVDQILKYLKQNLLTTEIENNEKLQIYIDQILENILSNKKHIYNDFIQALIEKDQFKDFYYEIVQACIEYIQEHLDESTFYSTINDSKRNFKEIKFKPLEEKSE